MFFILFCIITSSSISFSSCPSFTFHYNVNHSHYHHLKVSSPFSPVIFFCVCQFCFLIIGHAPFLNLLYSLEFFTDFNLCRNWNIYFCLFSYFLIYARTNFEYNGFLFLFLLRTEFVHLRFVSPCIIVQFK